MNNNINAALVVEPYLLKAFKLLHSKEKNSAEKLKAMLDEAIRSKNEKNGGGGGAACIPPPITCFTTAGSKLASLSATPKVIVEQHISSMTAKLISDLYLLIYRDSSRLQQLGSRVVG